jgi:hypothetical protein
MRHYYVGPHPVTQERLEAYFLPKMLSGEVGRIVRTGQQRFADSGPPVPWVEDDRPEPEERDSQQSEGPA